MQNQYLIKQKSKNKSVSVSFVNWKGKEYLPYCLNQFAKSGGNI
jgi:hypothetical protein